MAADESGFKVSSNPLPWTAADQARMDLFEAEILTVAEQWHGHPDLFPLAFVQVLGTLMRRALWADPGRLAQYQRAIEMLRTHVDQSVLPESQKH